MLQAIKAHKSENQFKAFLKTQYDLQGYSHAQRQSEESLYFLTEGDIEKVVEAVSCESLYASSPGSKANNRGFSDCTCLI